MKTFFAGSMCFAFMPCLVILSDYSMDVLGISVDGAYLLWIHWLAVYNRCVDSWLRSGEPHEQIEAAD
ncbi:hypothetical protein SP21_82 [Salmonella phage 21]|nr:hypothetical protein SP21_82 [Salmonella phage 21]